MKKPLLVSGLILLSACAQEQQPAPISDLGRQFYGQGAQNALSRPSQNTQSEAAESEQGSLPPNYVRGGGVQVQSAPAPVVGISDLPPTGGVASASSPSSPSPFSATPSKPLSPEENVSAMPPAGMNANTSTDAVSAQDGITLIWPVTGGRIIGHFKGEQNDGINIAMSDGEPIVAAASGTVVYSGNDLRDYGNMVILRHDNGWMTAYANASKIVARKGSYVKQGTIIAYVGTSGNVKTPQLHFALRKGRTPVDPEKYLPQS